MPSFLKQVVQFFAVIGCVPLIVGFVSAWLKGLGFLLFIFGVPIAILQLLIGLVFSFVRGQKLSNEETKTRNKIFILSASPLLFICMILLSWPLLIAGRHFGAMSRLLVNYAHYKSIITKIEKSPKPSWFEDDGGITYSVDLGPPIRVAFTPAGMLDNWSGIIYDPTGDIMQAHGFDSVTGKFAAPEKVTKLFGGDLVSCRHLWGRYYDCSFT